MGVAKSAVKNPEKCCLGIIAIPWESGTLQEIHQGGFCGDKCTPLFDKSQPTLKNSGLIYKDSENRIYRINAKNRLKMKLYVKKDQISDIIFLSSGKSDERNWYSQINI